jgi:hypothetical protein
VPQRVHAVAPAADVVGVRADELAALRRHAGPVLTVHLVTGGTGHRRPLTRWRTLRRRLAADGVPERALLQIEPLVDDSPGAPGTMVAIADEWRLLLLDQLDRSLDEDHGTWGRLPDLVPRVPFPATRVA